MESWKKLFIALNVASAGLKSSLYLEFSEVECCAAGGVILHKAHMMLS